LALTTMSIPVECYSRNVSLALTTMSIPVECYSRNVSLALTTMSIPVECYSRNVSLALTTMTSIVDHSVIMPLRTAKNIKSFHLKLPFLVNMNYKLLLSITTYIIDCSE
jgi:hypothetical protein